MRRRLVSAAARVLMVAAAVLLVCCGRDRPAGPAAAAPANAPAPQPPAGPSKTRISYDDARPILEALHAKLPAELKSKVAAELPAAWPEWVARHDAEVRARLDRGDEDSVVNFWLFGTTFTVRPRATRQDIARFGRGASPEDVLLGRLDDLVSGLASPGANERLQFARQVVERRGINLAAPSGREQARQYLIDARERVLVENERYRRTLRSAKDSRDRLAVSAELYSGRGLSSDTSLPVDFAVEQALSAVASKGRLAPGSVRRVGIVGPGLDFTDKGNGYDFYPQQTIQPFALIDSLIRVGLAKPDDLQVTTLDLSPRVNQHLEAARQRAQAGQPYVLQLPMSQDDEWLPALVTYWERFGARISDADHAMAAPPGTGSVKVRAVRVRPGVVLSIVPRDVNIVAERLELLAAGDRFDLIIATNILVYYDAFEQALALSNVAHMLRRGGFFLTNYEVSPHAPMEPAASLVTTVYWDRQRNGDTLFWYQRR